MDGDHLLTIKDLAAVLRLTEKTVYTMAKEGELPAFKIRGQWRVRKTDFDKWVCDRATGAAKSAALEE